jgi:ribosomal protein L14E/L6E/L27E
MVPLWRCGREHRHRGNAPEKKKREQSKAKHAVATEETLAMEREEYVHLISKAQQANNVDSQTDASNDQEWNTRVRHPLSQFFDLTKAG